MASAAGVAIVGVVTLCLAVIALLLLFTNPHAHKAMRLGLQFWIIKLELFIDIS